MMKNYEEALETFGGEPDNYGNYKTVTLPREKVQQDYKLLQETLKEYKLLKEKATPKLVMFVMASTQCSNPYDAYYCATCKRYISKYKMIGVKFCQNCGNALLWGEDDE